MYLFLPSRHLIKYLTDAMENHGESPWELSVAGCDGVRVESRPRLELTSVLQ